MKKPSRPHVQLRNALLDDHVAKGWMDADMVPRLHHYAAALRLEHGHLAWQSADSTGGFIGWAMV